MMDPHSIDSEYEPLADHPLFGLTSRRDQMLNVVVVIVTCILVIITTISAFIPHPTASEIFFVLCIILICAAHLILVFWYRQGDLDPKFKKHIYFNTVNIMLLCICANIFFH